MRLSFRKARRERRKQQTRRMLVLSLGREYASCWIAPKERALPPFSLGYWLHEPPVPPFPIAQPAAETQPNVIASMLFTRLAQQFLASPSELAVILSPGLCRESLEMRERQFPKPQLFAEHLVESLAPEEADSEPLIPSLVRAGIIANGYPVEPTARGSVSSLAVALVKVHLPSGVLALMREVQRRFHVRILPLTPVQLLRQIIQETHAKSPLQVLWVDWHTAVWYHWEGSVLTALREVSPLSLYAFLQTIPRGLQQQVRYVVWNDERCSNTLQEALLPFARSWIRPDVEAGFLEDATTSVVVIAPSLFWERLIVTALQEEGLSAVAPPVYWKQFREESWWFSLTSLRREPPIHLRAVAHFLSFVRA